MQVNDHGIISFNESYNVRTPRSFPLIGSPLIIAPYWADVDNRGTGQVFYRQTTDPSLLARATSEISTAFSILPGITMQNLLIVTWSGVGYYNQNTEKVMIILISWLLLYYCYMTINFAHTLQR